MTGSKSGSDSAETLLCFFFLPIPPPPTMQIRTELPVKASRSAPYTRTKPGDAALPKESRRHRQARRSQPVEHHYPVPPPVAQAHLNTDGFEGAFEDDYWQTAADESAADAADATGDAGRGEDDVFMANSDDPPPPTVFQIPPPKARRSARVKRVATPKKMLLYMKWDETLPKLRQPLLEYMGNLPTSVPPRCGVLGCSESMRRVTCVSWDRTLFMVLSVPVLTRSRLRGTAFRRLPTQTTCHPARRKRFLPVRSRVRHIRVLHQAAGLLLSPVVPLGGFSNGSGSRPSWIPCRSRLRLTGCGGTLVYCFRGLLFLIRDQGEVIDEGYRRPLQYAIQWYDILRSQIEHDVETAVHESKMSEHPVTAGLPSPPPTPTGPSHGPPRRRGLFTAEGVRRAAAAADERPAALGTPAAAAAGGPQAASGGPQAAPAAAGNEPLTAPSAYLVSRCPCCFGEDRFGRTVAE